MTLRIGSLFSGIGGLELGLERATGGRVVWQVEREPFCRAVLAKHWPDATRFDDVTAIAPFIRNHRQRGRGPWSDEAHHVDIICGGFPCQDISLAGKGAGLAGERSGLWREFARIIRLVRPRVVVVENVAALLARGLGDVLGDLAACGYDAAWDCVPAAAVGAPHRRDRLFVVAWRMGDPSRIAERESPNEGHAGSIGWRSRSLACGAGQRSEALADTGDDRRDWSAQRDSESQPGRQAVLARGDAAGRDDHVADASRGARLRRASGESRHAAFGDENNGGRAPQSRMGRGPDGLPRGLDGAFGRGIRRTREGAQKWPAGQWATPVARDDGKSVEAHLAMKAAMPGGPRRAITSLAVQIRAESQGWPSRPGEPQHPWEPPRTARDVPHRSRRLTALGNAVVPQVGEAIGHVVSEIIAMTGGAR